MNIRLKVCSSKKEHELFKDIINKHHSYMDYVKSPRRTINWLIYLNDEIIGCIGISSSVLRLKIRDKHIGIKNNEQALEKRNNIANNYRFCLIKDKINIPNCATQVLKKMREEAPLEWYKKYGDMLIGIETYVLKSHSGTIYKADNWKYLGLTQGFSFTKVPLKLLDGETLERYKKEKTVNFNKNNKRKRLFFFKFKEKELLKIKQKVHQGTPAGISFRRDTGKWRVRVYQDTKEINLGHFHSFHQAKITLEKYNAQLKAQKEKRIREQIKKQNHIDIKTQKLKAKILNNKAFQSLKSILRENNKEIRLEIYDS